MNIKLAAICISLFVLSSCSDSIDTSFLTVDSGIIDLKDQNTVLFFLTPDCPLCQLYSKEFLLLSKKYENELAFYGVLPGQLYSVEEVQHFKDSFQFNFPIIADQDYSLTDFMKATTTPEFVLLDSTLSIQYQGKMDDWATDLAQKKNAPTKFYLENAIKSFLNGEEIQTKFVSPVGCAIER